MNEKRQIPPSELASRLKEIRYLFNNQNSIEIKSQEELDRIYYKEMRNWQKVRAINVTAILLNYKKQQEERYKSKKRKRELLFYFLFCVISIFTLFITILIFYIVYSNNIELGVLITSCITYLGALISVLVIIVKYVFPADEEKYFTELVKSIIDNDTERTKQDYSLLQNKKGK